MPEYPFVNPERGTVSASTTRGATHATRHVDDAALLLQAKNRFRASAEREARMRAAQLEDQKFRASEQWPLAIKAEREQDGRPCITINRLPVFIRQVTNQQRQAKPAITINPIDSGSDPETAEVFQGIIRNIEVNSQADIAYDTACDHQVTIGRGFFRVVAEWNDLNPWEQDLKIKRIRNPFTVYFDPAVTEADYHDARYAFVVEDMPRDEFVAQYGEEDARSAELFESVGDRSADWMPEGKVRVAEYYYIETTDEDITLLSDKSEVPTAITKTPAFQQMLAEAGLTTVRSRVISRRQVKWVKMTGAKILEKRDWPGRWIPIIPVLGDEIDINGEIDLRGMVRDARDPQRMYNYWVSAETETIALAPRSPFIVAEGQMEGYEDKWKMANRRNFPYLTYKVIDVQGTPIGPPGRNAIEPPIAAIVAATKQSDNDLKAVTGIYDASLGERGPQESARAIMSRQKQSDVANINWIDNLARAMRALGRILLDLIPHIYDAPRVMRILGMDEKPRLVMVHAGNADSVPAKDQLEEGVQGVYDLSAGRYDVSVTIGPSYQSRRQEAVEAMAEFIKVFPPAAPAIGDVLAENMDWPGAAVIAKRLRKMVPPQLLDDQGAPDKDQQLQAAQQKLMQAGQMVEMLTQHVNELTDREKAKSVENESREKIATQGNQVAAASKAAELASRERIIALQEHTKLLIAQMTAAQSGQLSQAGFEHEAHLQQLEHEHALQRETLERRQDAQLALHQSAMDRAGAVDQANLDRESMLAEHGLERERMDAEHGLERERLQAESAQSERQQGRDHAHEAGMTAMDLAHQRAATTEERAHGDKATKEERAHSDKTAQADRKHELQVIKAKPRPKPAGK